MAALAHADPENFMVGRFTFVRPPKWKWVWNDEFAKAGLLLTIPDSDTNEGAQVYFRTFKKDEGSVERRTKAWRATFKESAEDLKVRSETKDVAGFSIVYIEMEGTSLHQSRPDYSLFAVIIKTKEEHVVGRISGRKKVVDDSKIIFREMVERAVKEREPD